MIAGFFLELRRLDVTKSISQELKDSVNLTGDVNDAIDGQKYRKEYWDQLMNSTIPVIKRNFGQPFQELLGVENSG